jgi:hypothetical protein
VPGDIPAEDPPELVSHRVGCRHDLLLEALADVPRVGDNVDLDGAD